MISSGLIAVEIDLEGHLLTLLTGTDGQKAASWAVCWAVIVGDDGGLQLSLQGLPSSIKLVGSKPSQRGDNVPAIPLLRAPRRADI